MAKGGIYWMSLKVNLRNHDLWVKYFRCVEKGAVFASLLQGKFCEMQFSLDKTRQN